MARRGTWYLPSLNHPQGVKYREHLAPVDTLVRLKLPWQSTQVLPTITLCAVLLGGTRLNTSPVLRSLILDLPAEYLESLSKFGCYCCWHGHRLHIKRPEQVFPLCWAGVLGSCEHSPDGHVL